MSVQTYIQGANENCPDYKAAKKMKAGEWEGCDEELEEWELCYGDIDRRPGSLVEIDDAVEETDDEYGGWIVV